MRPPLEEVICFGSMRLYRASRILFDGDVPVRMGGRAMDLLIALIDRAPGVVTKAELETLVWPNTMVEDSSLRVQIGSLRKVIGDSNTGVRYIANVPGRGYSFVAPLTTVLPDGESIPSDKGSAAQVLSVPLRGNLPVRLTKMVGRARAVETVTALLIDRRLVTIIGAGGVGKTTLAIAVAEGTLGATSQTAVFVDLSVVSEPSRVAAVIGSALGMTVAADQPQEILVEQLKNRDDLLVLDNCEHLINEVAGLVFNLLRAAPSLRILATSREALRVTGERVYQLESLDTPPPGVTLNAKVALAFPSVALLVERASSDFTDFELTDADAPLAGELCRRLDGLPLAIEMAAARIGFFGLRDLVARLDDRLRLLAGNRAELPRHQTLNTLLDWSYVQLSYESQTVLTYLSVFAGAFTLEAASRLVVARQQGESTSVIEVIVDLAAKSLVVADFNGENVRYRLLVTTRHFAREKLRMSAERSEIHRRHARYLIEHLTEANGLWTGAGRLEWAATYGGFFDEVLYALEWGMSSEGDVVLSAELALVAMHLVHQLSVYESYQQYLKRIQANFSAVAQEHPLLEMRLNVALAGIMGLSGVPLPEVEVIHQRGLDAARRIGDGLHHCENPYAMFLGASSAGDYLRVLEVAMQVEAVSGSFGHEAGVLIGRRMLSQAHQFLGHHAESRELALEVLRSDHSLVWLGNFWIDPVNRQVSMRMLLARNFWFEGYADKAQAKLLKCLKLGALEIHSLQCQILATVAFPIAYWSGDLEAATAYAKELVGIASKHGLGFWKRWGQAFEMVLDSREVQLVRPADNTLADMLCTIAPQYVDILAIERVRSGIVGWCGPEVLRVWADRLLQEGLTDEAVDCYGEAIELAREQGALAWELRAVTSLASLLRSKMQVEAARMQLQKVLSLFTEGFETKDYKAASALLDELKMTGPDTSPGLYANTGPISRDLR